MSNVGQMVKKCRRKMFKLPTTRKRNTCLWCASWAQSSRLWIDHGRWALQKGNCLSWLHRCIPLEYCLDSVSPQTTSFKRACLRIQLDDFRFRHCIVYSPHFRDRPCKERTQWNINIKFSNRSFPGIWYMVPYYMDHESLTSLLLVQSFFLLRGWLS